MEAEHEAERWDQYLTKKKNKKKRQQQNNTPVTLLDRAAKNVTAVSIMF